MGQLVSRPPPPTDAQYGRKKPQLSRRSARHHESPKLVLDSCARRDSVISRGDAKALVNSSDKAETQHRRARRHSDSRHKETSPRSSKAHDVSASRKQSHRRTISDRVDSKFHRHEKADPPPSKTKIKTRRLRTYHSSSSLHSLTKHSKHTKEIKDCAICADALPLRRFPNRPPTVQCQHDVDACRKCLRTWIRSEFATKIWEEMTCPICSLRMQHSDMREFAPSDIFRRFVSHSPNPSTHTNTKLTLPSLPRYDKLSTRAALEAIPGFTWCIAKGCKSGHIHNTATATNKFTCMACNKSHCTQHNVSWHKRETCREYDYRTNKSIKKGEEEASRALIAQTTKKCPGPNCGKNIEKNNGCDHMTCKFCFATIKLTVAVFGS